jgi:hypothetical protein
MFVFEKEGAKAVLNKTRIDGYLEILDEVENRGPIEGRGKAVLGLARNQVSIDKIQQI